MFLPVECYVYDWEEEDWNFTEMKINPAHIETLVPDTTFGDYCYVTFVSGNEMIIAMSEEDFEKVVHDAQRRTLLS